MYLHLIDDSINSAPLTSIISIITSIRVVGAQYTYIIYTMINVTTKSNNAMIHTLKHFVKRCQYKLHDILKLEWELEVITYILTILKRISYVSNLLRGSRNPIKVKDLINGVKILTWYFGLWFKRLKNNERIYIHSQFSEIDNEQKIYLEKTNTINFKIQQ